MKWLFHMISHLLHPNFTQKLEKMIIVSINRIPLQETNATFRPWKPPIKFLKGWIFQPAMLEIREGKCSKLPNSQKKPHQIPGKYHQNGGFSNFPTPNFQNLCSSRLLLPPNCQWPTAHLLPQHVWPLPNETSQKGLISKCSKEIWKDLRKKKPWKIVG